MSSCQICASPVRETVDAALASDTHASPRRLSKLFPRYSRQQVRRHRDDCLAGLPRTIFALSTGRMTEEDVRERLEEEGAPEEVEEVLAVVGRVRGEGGGR